MTKINRIDNIMYTITLYTVGALILVMSVAIVYQIKKADDSTQKSIQICKDTYGSEYTEIRNQKCYNPYRFVLKEIPKD